MSISLWIIDCAPFTKKGILIWFIMMSIYYIMVQGGQQGFRYPYLEEVYHYPGMYMTTQPTPWVNKSGYRVPNTDYTPDFRVEEPYYTVHSAYFFKERNRPYRLSPHWKQTRWWDWWDRANNLGCYCCTVFKKFVVLASCAVLTTRHVLTTATSTEIVLRPYRSQYHLEDILGLWYDVDSDLFNSSFYSTPARIHYHPKYRFDYEVNVSHPIPCMYDIALWAVTYNIGSWWPRPIVCQRAASSWRRYSHTIPHFGDTHCIVGFLFMKAFGRRPMPWYKYGVRTGDHVWPCPKSDWHWFHCVHGSWARYGMDSGGAMHFMDRGNTRREDGLAGICAFSMHLRSRQITHYFTVIDTYPVIDFLYDAYMGRLPYEYLDGRFWDTQWQAPRLYYDEHIPHLYTVGYQGGFYHPPNYRR